jgi:hypothetical protein
VRIEDGISSTTPNKLRLIQDAREFIEREIRSRTQSYTCGDICELVGVRFLDERGFKWTTGNALRRMLFFIVTRFRWILIRMLAALTLAFHLGRNGREAAS